MEELQKGQKVKIKFKVSPIRAYEIGCVIKWVENDRISLHYPEDRKELAKYLHEGKDLEIVIYTDKGIYIFESLVIDSPFEFDFIVEYPEERTKIQRREYVRAPIKLDFILTKAANQRTRTETINIGGGGVRFKTDKELEVGDIWNFMLYLPRWEEPAKGQGEILYSIKQENQLVSVIRFSDISESDRNKIIKLCFEEEANRLKKRTNMIQDYN